MQVTPIRRNGQRGTPKEPKVTLKAPKVIPRTPKVPQSDSPQRPKCPQGPPKSPKGGLRWSPEASPDLLKIDQKRNPRQSWDTFKKMNVSALREPHYLLCFPDIEKSRGSHISQTK